MNIIAVSGKNDRRMRMVRTLQYAYLEFLKIVSYEENIDVGCC